MKKKLIGIGLLTVMLVLSACSAPKNYDNATSETANYEEGSEPGYGGTEIQRYEVDGESYLTIDENREKSVEEESIVTFSLKVDTAAYTNVSRYINSGIQPPVDAVRTEELLNYFSYENHMEYKDGPFYISAEIADSPYSERSKIAMVRVKTQEIDTEDMPLSNLVFLIDTSGSMDSYDKLPLLKEAFGLLTETLGENDRVSIVTYAGSSEIVLDSESGDNKAKIIKAINELKAGGGTYGEGGIQTAYALAEKNFIEGGNNRIILATDGDFNLGVRTTGGLEDLISEKRESGIYLSILGFGMGNLKDDNMETLSKHGNGNYAYISTVSDAQKVLVEEIGSNLFTVAKDVKAQIEFDSANMSSYRVIGYENRMLNNEDFEDDTKDAGEIGAGTDVVMLFELVLTEGEAVGDSDTLFELRIRYKEPDGEESKEVNKSVYMTDIKENASTDLNFACAVAGFAHLLRASDALGEVNAEMVLYLAKENIGEDKGNYRREFITTLNQYIDMK